MTAGRKISKKQFDLLPEKMKIIILRNRKHALSTRKKRKNEIIKLQRENSIIESGNELMERQIRVFCHLFNKDVPYYLYESFHTFVFPLIEMRSLENVSDRKLRKRIHSHNALATLKNRLNELQIAHILLLERNEKFRSILKEFVPTLN